MSMSINIGDDADELDDEQRPIGEVDDDDDDRPARQTDDDDDRDGGEEEDDLADKSDDDLRDEIRRLRSALTKSNANGARQRAQKRELKKLLDEQSNRDDDDPDDEEEPDEKPKADGKPAIKGYDARAVQRRVDKARKQERERLEQEHRRDLIETRAESAFVRAGVSEKNLRLLKRELDFDEIDFDPKTRSIDGLDEEIDRLKTEFPDLFRGTKAVRRRINGGDNRDADRKKRPLSATEQQVLALTGRTR